MTIGAHSAVPSAVSLKRSLPIVRDESRVEPPVRGERLFRALDRASWAVERRLTVGLRSDLNPLSHAGAVANTLFAVACVSGIVLLLWYQTSVHQAYDSVVAMGRSPYGSGLVRSIHRYSSDGCMLFVLIHAARMLFARRFGGARWLAWVTGVLALAALWFVGWLGYWLVWDERARQVALGTARVLDALPIFADPISRSFLTDRALSSLSFFVVFFVHMLLPLAMGVALWLHIARLSRPAFFTRRALTIWLLASLTLVSLLAPADVARPARMALVPQPFEADAWFLLPIALSDRLSAGALWAVMLIGGALTLSLPWSLVGKRARPAVVAAGRCNACQRCVNDCPYDAISMQPRSDGRAYPAVAVVDESKCIGCGICAGSCDSAGIGLPWFDAIHQRRRLEQMIDSVSARPAAVKIAFVCQEQPIRPSLSDHEVVEVPCAGWVHPLLAERAVKRGAANVTVVPCSPSACRYREGVKWTEQRFSGQRQPRLRVEKVGPNRVSVSGEKSSASWRAAAGVTLVVTLSLAMWAGSRLPYVPPPQPGELVISLKHTGALLDGCRELTAEEKRELGQHMRPNKICERGRAPVRVRLTVDDAAALTRTYAPSGLWGDGSSIGLESFPLSPGRHHVRVEVGDSNVPGSYGHVTERDITSAANQRNVVVFEGGAFRWDVPEQSRAEFRH